MNEDDLIKESFDVFQKKVAGLLEEKAKLRKLKADREKAVGLWTREIKEFISSISKSLLKRLQDVYDAQFAKVTAHHEVLIRLNKDCTLNPDQSREELEGKIREMEALELEPNLSSEFDFIQLNPNNNNNNACPEIQKAFVNPDQLPDLGILNVLCFENSGDESTIVSTPKILLPKAENFGVEDSFYCDGDAVFGVHFIKNETDKEEVICKAKKDNIDELNELSIMEDENKLAICSKCGQTMSVLLQLKLAQEKEAASKNSSDGTQLTSPKPISREGSGKKNVSFQQQTTILEEELDQEGVSTPKVSQGSIKIENGEVDEFGNRRTTRSNVTMISPPLQQKDLINLSASKTLRRRLSTDGLDKKKLEKVEKKLEFSDDDHNSGVLLSLSTSTSTQLAIMSFKYDNFGPTSISKSPQERNIFVCSPFLNKVAVLDAETNSENGYLKLPNNKLYNNPRNVHCLGSDGSMMIGVTVLDKTGLHLFIGGKFTKTIFESTAQNFRGLASLTDGHLVSLEIINETLNLIIIDYQKEIITKRIGIEAGAAKKTTCRFLAAYNDFVVISDMSSGRLFGVDLSVSPPKQKEIASEKVTKATGIAFDDFGNFAVADIGSDKIHIFDKNGIWIRESVLPELEKPAGIHLDVETKRLFVADNKSHVVRKYQI